MEGHTKIYWFNNRESNFSQVAGLSVDGRTAFAVAGPRRSAIVLVHIVIYGVREAVVLAVLARSAICRWDDKMPAGGLIIFCLFLSCVVTTMWSPDLSFMVPFPYP